MKNIGYSYNGFTTARLKRFLNTGGQSFMFIKTEKNKFGESTETVSSSTLILGVLHESNQTNNSVLTSEDSKSRNHSKVLIITSWESLFPGYSGGKELSPGMFIVINGTTYSVIKSLNVNHWNLIAEVSLEEFDEWQH